VSAHVFDRAATAGAEAMSAWRTATETPGLAVALVAADQEPRVLVDGLADLAGATPVRPDHRFHAGSITKSFTALVAFRLAEQGAFDLDLPIERYLPWFRVREPLGPILVRHLLTHQGGLVIGAELSETTPLDVWLLRETDAAWAPGEGYSYSNAGYAAVGFALEAATGRPFGDLVRDTILDPVGMRQASPSIDDATRPFEATGYRRRVEPDLRLGDIEVAPRLSGSNAQGSLVASAGDLARYLQMLLRRGVTTDGVRLLRPATFRRMTSRQARIDRRRWYAFGLRTYALDGRKVIEHGGETLGFRASMIGDVTAGVGVVVLANLVDTKPLHLAEFLVRAMRSDRADEDLPPYRDPAPDRPIRLPTVGTDELPRRLRGFAGRYVSTSPWRRPIDIVAGRDGLVLRIPGVDDAELLSAGRQRFRMGSELGPEQVTFDALVGGRALRLSFSAHPYVRSE
jgi:CubicO group peptidase (beta-lactamase class C family)